MKFICCHVDGERKEGFGMKLGFRLGGLGLNKLVEAHVFSKKEKPRNSLRLIYLQAENLMVLLDGS